MTLRPFLCELLLASCQSLARKQTCLYASNTSHWQGDTDEHRRDNHLNPLS
jgi:hypothetical protein